MEMNRSETAEYTIRVERPGEERITENVVRESFWNVYRPGCLEHYILHCFREDPDFIPELNLVMEKDGRMIGQIMFARAFVTARDGSKIPVVTFGPVSILPEFQGKGLGRALIEYGLDRAKEMGAGAVFIVGDDGFYEHLGFVNALSRGIRYEFADREDEEIDYVLMKELQDGYLKGVIGMWRDPDGYRVCMKDPFGFQEFESEFPYKAMEFNDDQLFG